MKIIATPRSVDFETLDLLPLGVIVVDAQGTVLDPAGHRRRRGPREALPADRQDGRGPGPGAVRPERLGEPGGRFRPGTGGGRLLTSREAGSFMVDIIDDGVGMDLPTQQKVFTPMFTTKGDRGNGLGLAAAHGTIRRHGGSIKMNSNQGQGTHFRLVLPEETAP